MKQSTVNEYARQMNKVIEYITNHLDEEISLSSLASVSGFSPYHFHRITRAFLGESLGNFIVRMRTETAARLLRYTSLTVAEIAYRVGYDVPGSLTKAFKQLYGITPVNFRKNKNLTITRPLIMDETLNIKKPKILTIPQKNVIYIKLFGNYSELDFRGTWKKLWQFVKSEKLYSAGIEHLAIYHHDPKITEGDKLCTDICLAITKQATAKGEVGVKEMPGGKYAMFLYTGSYEYLEGVYNNIYGKLLSEYQLQLRDSPGFEKYLNHPEHTLPEKLKTEIYIPVE